MQGPNMLINMLSSQQQQKETVRVQSTTDSLGKIADSEEVPTL